MRQLRRAIRSTDDGLQLVPIVATVVMACSCVGCVWGDGRATAAGGCCGGGANDVPGDGLSVAAAGELGEGVSGQLEHGLLALADLELFGGGQSVVELADSVGFGGWKKCQSHLQRVSPAPGVLFT